MNSNDPRRPDSAATPVLRFHLGTFFSAMLLSLLYPFALIQPRLLTTPFPLLFLAIQPLSSLTNRGHLREFTHARGLRK